MDKDFSAQILAEMAERVHKHGPAAFVIGGNGDHGRPPSMFDLLWTRKAIAGSPLARHVEGVRRRTGGAKTGWSYDPELAWRTLREAPAVMGVAFEAHSRACSEMVEHGCALLEEIGEVRAGKHRGNRVWQVPVQVGEDAAGAILARARAGANEGRTTKSNPGLCTNLAWAEVMSEFGLAGLASMPTVSLGSWLMAPMVRDFPDWRLDYLIMLTYTFYFEYNIDSASFGDQRTKRVLEELNLLFDMPDLSAELQARRLHMTCSMAFFDTKRKREAGAREMSTDGLTAWAHRDRDWWRDFKAVDSGGFAHYLSFVAGEAGRDDMMLTGVTNDWVDLGPDLRNGECNQSVLAMTRGSITMDALLQCYQRSIWMMNAQLNPDGTIKAERYGGCAATMGTCIWEMSNHRHDVWRYYLIGIDACAQAAACDLYRAGQLADCYGEDFTPREPSPTTRLNVSRRRFAYEIAVGGERYTGEISLHVAVCDAVECGVLPGSIVEYSYVLPLLVREGRITKSTFLSHMDRVYCDNFATVMRAAHASGCSEIFGRAIAGLASEQWWCGMYFAIGLGSLIESQPGRVANDRAH